MNKIFDVTADKMQETMSTFTLNEIYQQIIKAFQTEETKQVINETYKGAYLPAWD